MPRKPAKHPAKPKRGKKLEIEEPGVLYGRYSSHNQKDISVEQQFEKGYELAAEYGIRIIDTYADRAVSGRTDKRRDFQRMMTDAAKGKFRYVIAWKSNRMGRNMLEALINEARLQDLGVRVLYVEEDFDDTAAGRFAARSMMNVNQFYSENMAEDIKRGLYDNAANCMVANGHLPYGYKADETLHYAIDEPKAAVIREIFTRVSCGEAFVDIMASLNARGIKTSYGRPWGRSSFQKILSNERYRGIYIYGDVRKEGGIPRIISDELYFKVQEVITTKKNPQGRHRVNGDYLLTGKLFCGHCKSPMTGVSGTGRSGNLHYYYVCQKRRTEKTCDKKNVRRDEIELQVAQAIKDYALKDDVIEWIADSTVAYNERKEAESKVGILEDQLAGTEHGIKNIMSAIEQGIITETTKSRLVELESERAAIKANIAAARADIVTVSRDDIISGLEMFRDGDVHDKKYQARLFDTFLVAVYAYDDDLRLVFSFSGNKNTIQIPIESAVNAVENNEAECSFKLCSAPPNVQSKDWTFCFFGVSLPFTDGKAGILTVFFEKTGKTELKTLKIEYGPPKAEHQNLGPSRLDFGPRKTYPHIEDKCPAPKTLGDDVSIPGEVSPRGGCRYEDQEDLQAGGTALSAAAGQTVSHHPGRQHGDHQPAGHYEPAEGHGALHLRYPRRIRGVPAHPELLFRRG